MRRWPAAVLACSLLLACDSKNDPSDEANAEPAREIPAKPAHGSPIAAEFDGFTGEDGGDGERGVKIHLYNFGDKPAVHYTLVARYFDASNTLLKVQRGTPFEKDTAFTSMAGNKYRCKPKGHLELELDGPMMQVPAEATHAELRITSVGTLGADGMTIEEWWKKGRFGDWPEEG